MKFFNKNFFILSQIIFLYDMLTLLLLTKNKTTENIPPKP